MQKQKTLLRNRTFRSLIDFSENALEQYETTVFENITVSHGQNEKTNFTCIDFRQGYGGELTPDQILLLLEARTKKINEGEDLGRNLSGFTVIGSKNNCYLTTKQFQDLITDVGVHKFKNIDVFDVPEAHRFQFTSLALSCGKRAKFKDGFLEIPDDTELSENEWNWLKKTSISLHFGSNVTIVKPQYTTSIHTPQENQITNDRFEYDYKIKSINTFKEKIVTGEVDLSTTQEIKHYTLNIQGVKFNGKVNLNNTVFAKSETSDAQFIDGIIFNYKTDFSKWSGKVKMPDNAPITYVNNQGVEIHTTVDQLYSELKENYNNSFWFDFRRKNGFIEKTLEGKDKSGKALFETKGEKLFKLLQHMQEQKKNWFFHRTLDAFNDVTTRMIEQQINKPNKPVGEDSTQLGESDTDQSDLDQSTAGQPSTLRAAPISNLFGTTTLVYSEGSEIITNASTGQPPTSPKKDDDSCEATSINQFDLASSRTNKHNASKPSNETKKVTTNTYDPIQQPHKSPGKYDDSYVANNISIHRFDLALSHMNEHIPSELSDEIKNAINELKTNAYKDICDNYLENKPTGSFGSLRKFIESDLAKHPLIKKYLEEETDIIDFTKAMPLSIQLTKCIMDLKASSNGQEKFSSLAQLSYLANEAQRNNLRKIYWTNNGSCDILKKEAMLLADIIHNGISNSKHDKLICTTAIPDYIIKMLGRAEDIKKIEDAASKVLNHSELAWARNGAGEIDEELINKERACFFSSKTKCKIALHAHKLQVFIKALKTGFNPIEIITHMHHIFSTETQQSIDNKKLTSLFKEVGQLCTNAHTHCTHNDEVKLFLQALEKENKKFTTGVCSSSFFLKEKRQSVTGSSTMTNGYQSSSW